MVDKIAVIKTGWSDDFMGSPVEAAHQYVREFKDGSERFNFLPGPDGRFYAYTPPLGEKLAAPNPKEHEGWLVFSVAKKPNEKGLCLTGWYENATFTGYAEARPEYDQDNPSLPFAENNEPYHYVLSSPKAVRVDPRVNKHVFAGDHMRRSSIFYLKGNGASGQWRSSLARRLLAIRENWDESRPEGQSKIVSNGRGGICADSERRKQVEEAAIKLVKARYPSPRYEIIDKQLEKCGFDLLIRVKKPKGELHIEVKGTQNEVPHFLMSHKEYTYMQAYRQRWRLAMVTSALSKTPSLAVMDATEAERRFSWQEFTWHAVGK